eukprot:UN26341
MDSDWNSEDDEEWKDFDDMVTESKLQSPPKKKRKVERVCINDVQKLPNFQKEMEFAEDLKIMRQRIDEFSQWENIIKMYFHWMQCKTIGILTANTEAERITEVIVTLR